MLHGQAYNMDHFDNGFRSNASPLSQINKAVYFKDIIESQYPITNEFTSLQSYNQSGGEIRANSPASFSNAHRDTVPIDLPQNAERKARNREDEMRIVISASP